MLDQSANQLPDSAEEADDWNFDFGLLQRQRSPHDDLPGVCCLCKARCESLVFVIADLILCALLLGVSIVDLKKLKELSELTEGRYMEVNEEDEDVAHSRNITHSRWEQGKLNYWNSYEELDIKISLSATRFLFTVMRSIACGLLIFGMMKRNSRWCKYWFHASMIYILSSVILQVGHAILFQGDISFWAHFGLEMVFLISMQVYGTLVVVNVVKSWGNVRLDLAL